MADTKVSSLTANTTPLSGDYLLQVDDPTGTPTSKRMTIGDLNIANGPVQGGLKNGYISRTVSSNNLIVAIKTIAGADPSATDPVYVRVGNSVRTLTAALSVTTTAGTDIYGMNASGTLSDQDLFVYIGWRAAGSALFIGVSRIPYGVTYANFSVTTTAATYLNYSGSAPASTDEVENIGRVNATTTGTATYNWSVPATSIVISRPIFQTRLLSWTPTLTGYSAAPTATVYNYQITNNTVAVYIREGTNGTSNATSMAHLAPFPALTVTNGAWAGFGFSQDNTAAVTTTTRMEITSGATTINEYPNGSGSSTWTAAGGKRLMDGFIQYPI